MLPADKTKADETCQESKDGSKIRIISETAKDFEGKIIFWEKKAKKCLEVLINCYNPLHDIHNFLLNISLNNDGL